MITVTTALAKAETICSKVTRLATAPSRSELKAAVASIANALVCLTEALEYKPAPKPAKTKKINGHVLKITATEAALELIESEWNPCPASSRIESTRCKALLLEIVKRAIHDWVLYRTHSELIKATFAKEAYTWLFEEDEDHPDFKTRKKLGDTITSFVVICEVTDLRPEELRRHIRTLKVSDVMGTGRPAERRRRPPDEVSIDQHELAGVSIESFEPAPNYRYTVLEQHYAPTNLSYV